MTQAGVPKTQYIELFGKCKFLNTKLVPNQYNAWDHLLYPTQDSLKTIRKLQDGWVEGVEGIMTELKQDEEGYFMRLRRPSKKETRAGKVITFTPPIILNADGVSPFTGLIGNGSDVMTKVELYFYKKPFGTDKKLGSAIRWMATRVDTLVPYDGPRDMNELDKKMSQQMDRVTHPAAW